MKLKFILFDLDGTLLPMVQETFVKAYFTGLAKRLATIGYKPDEFIEALWSGITAMFKNDTDSNNEKIFWKKFCEIYGDRAIEDLPHFEKFYNEDFDKIKDVCGYTPKANELITLLKLKNYRLVLATNPVFPAVATKKRIRWAGLSPDDFELITTYENSFSCKPNKKYYEDILNEIGAVGEECLMVGNDVNEDMIARELGMRVFLLTDCIINKNNKDILEYPNGSFEELINYIASQE